MFSTSEFEIKNLDKLRLVFDAGFNIVVQNSQGEIILLVEVKDKHLQNSERSKHLNWFIDQVVDCLETKKIDIFFSMLVDLDRIEIFRSQEICVPDISTETINLETANILSNYESGFSNKPIFNYYLEGLVEAWIDDLIYHWKYQKPPASEKLEKIGLLQKLGDGITISKRMLSGETLY